MGAYRIHFLEGCADGFGDAGARELLDPLQKILRHLDRDFAHFAHTSIDTIVDAGIQYQYGIEMAARPYRKYVDPARASDNTSTDFERLGPP